MLLLTNRQMKKHILLFFSILFYFSGFGQSSDSMIVAMKTKLKEAKQDTAKLSAITELAWQYTFKNLDSSEWYANEELRMAKQIHSEKWESMANNDLGIIRLRQGNNKEAISYFEQSLVYRLKSGDSAQIASTYSKMANAYLSLSMFEQSLNYLYPALRIYQRSHNDTYSAIMMGGLAVAFINLKDYQKARTYINEACALQLKTGDEYGYWENQMNLAILESDEKHYEKATEIAQQCVVAFHQFGDPYSEAMASARMGNALRDLRRDKEALVWYKKALALADSAVDEYNAAIYLQNIANTLIDLGEYAQAAPYLDKGWQLAGKLEDMEAMSDLAYTRTRYFIHKGNTEEANVWLDKYVALRDSLLEKANVRYSQEMDVKYATEIREGKIKNLSNENRIKELELRTNISELKTSRLISISLVIGLIIVGLSAFFILSRQRIAAKLKLAEVKAAEHERGLKAVIEAQENERRQIARDLHDSIGQQLAALKMRMDQPVEKNLPYLENAIREVRSISHRMMPVTLEREGLDAALRELAQDSTTGKLQVEYDSFNLSGIPQEEAALTMYRSAQEIISNAIRHSGATNLQLSLYTKGEQLILMAEDNGKGLNDTSANGIGLTNIKTRIAGLGGEIRFENKSDGGLHITILLPHTKTNHV